MARVSRPLRERRRIDRTEAPAGAATEAAIARTIELEGVEAAAEAQGADAAEHESARGGVSFLALAVTAAGVVYGDIGTSPLYALREAFRGGYGLTVTPANVFGVLSLIVWALI